MVVNHASVDEGYVIPQRYSIRAVDVTEKMQLGLQFRNSLEQFCTSKMATSAVEVKNAHRRLVGYQDVNALGNQMVLRDGHKFAVLNSHLHWSTVEEFAIDENTAVRENVHVIGKAFDFCVPHRDIMVSCNEDFVLVRLAAEPVEEIKRLVVAARKGAVTAVYQHVAVGQRGEVAVLAVSVGYVNNLHDSMSNIF